MTLNPDTDDRLRAGDWLVLAGKDETLDRLGLDALAVQTEPRQLAAAR